ncbi:MAG: cupin domain-containing protein [Pseudomonadota bacterium]|nr:cupin domain-containing protein [Pseudomonadota bacterium]
MRKHQLSLIILASLTLASPCLAQSSQERIDSSASTGSHTAHVVVVPDQVKWGPAPPSLPPGAQLAVLEGDPSKAGAPFTIRGKFPDGYRVPPHWHPTDERIVVLQGVFGMGVGEKFDQATGHELPVGSYALMPKGVRHFVWAKGETVIQVSGMGPFEINYVNPADDPRKVSKE